MVSRLGNRLCRTVVYLAACFSTAPATATTLITVKEARLPPDTSRTRGGIEWGPDIIPIYPAVKSGAIQSPFDFRVRFKAHGNATIDLDSVIVIYKRDPPIDLTARLRPFVKSDGIDMPNAEVPAGSHRIVIFVEDSVGRKGLADFLFNVQE